GQAKGIIMATLHCDADTAFDLIRQQSQVENRKAIEIASEIVTRVSRRATPLNGVPSASSTEE
ncbi:MAG: hypothetical protein JWN99_2682, partial [Ilumatobacteraceae bacterium]|nr:hypothetical protein [Ilumatobacteraceae bacterium]